MSYNTFDVPEKCTYIHRFCTFIECATFDVIGDSFDHKNLHRVRKLCITLHIYKNICNSIGKSKSYGRFSASPFLGGWARVRGVPYYVIYFHFEIRYNAGTLHTLKNRY